jgi:alpha-ribazole phosphatase
VKRVPLIAIRHTPVIGGQGLCYGRTDLDVHPRDVSDAARKLRAALPDWPIVSSPLSRARQLAEATARAFRIEIAPARGVPPSPWPLAKARSQVREVRTDARLAELHFGQWESRPWRDIERSALDAWAADPAGFQMPDGERYLDLEARVAAALSDVTEPTLWFTHAGVIRALHHLISGIERDDALQIAVPYATPVRF